jgi:glycosyltransferase involved in cell wall biosynthesis
MKKIRILEVIPNLGSGGAERLVVDLASNINKEQFEVEVASLYDSTGLYLEKELHEKHITVHVLNKRIGPDFSIFLKLSRLLNRSSFDIVHSHLYGLRYLLPLISIYKHKCAFFHTIHNVAQHEVDAVGRVLNRVCFRLGVNPITISPAIEKTFIDLYSRTSIMIANGISVEKFSSPAISREQWRKKAGFREDHILVVSVARFSPQKNHKMLLHAFADALSKIDADANVDLLLVGDGPLREGLTQNSSSLGISTHVHFLGVRDDVSEILNASDIFVLASDYEGNPLSVMEAMASQTTVVCTAVGGVPDLVEDGIDGFLVPAGETDMLSSVLKMLIVHEEVRSKVSKAARLKANEYFDSSIMIRAYEDLFINAIKSRLKSI